MSKTLNTQLGVSNIDTEVTIIKQHTLEKNQNTQLTSCLNHPEIKHKSSMNELFGFKQSKIIIIDANETSRTRLDRLLQDWQCDTQSFNSAEEAIVILARQTWKPSLIISNFHLADNNLGTNAIKLIQDFYTCYIQSVILAGDDIDPVKSQLTEDRACTILHKPINVAQLRFVMKKKIFPSTKQDVSA